MVTEKGAVMPHKSAGERELQAISGKLEELMQTVMQQFVGLKRGLDGADFALLKTIVAGDDKVDSIEIDLDDLSMVFVANRAPMGSSLRFMFGAIDVASALERIGDCIEYVARHAIETRHLREECPEGWHLLQDMTTKAFTVYERAVTSLSNRDSKLAKTVPAMDDLVDALQDQAYKLVIGLVRGGGLDVEIGIHLILMANKLESIADIACHIAQTVIYIVEDARVRHQHHGDQEQL
jgi:phosphate transport system protein